ncbi:MAG: Crp/Fnr family transcriptional regulator [Thiomicrospira sp.]|jgi:CRP-like cAMP-binding protein|nr:Crp/Fnr family transcriptional regulator [Thiomicrospira sp.]
MLRSLPEPLLKLARPKALKAKQMLFHVGEKPRFLYFVESGKIQLSRCLNTGAECVLQVINQGFLAEASVFNHQYHCDAHASVDSHLLAFPIAEFKQDLHYPAFRDMWIQLLSQEIKRLRNQVERLSLKTAQQRILHFLFTEGDGECYQLTQTKKAWANELGLSHEALYRNLNSLQKSGEIVINQQRICFNRRNLKTSNPKAVKH